MKSAKIMKIAGNSEGSANKHRRVNNFTSILKYFIIQTPEISLCV